MAVVAGDDVDRVRRDRALAGDVEEALGDHRFGTARALLARLEHEDHVAGEVVAGRAEQLGRADEHRHVQIVAAGVHRTRHRGRVLQARLLLHRQRIHVAAQQHRAARPAAAQHGDDRGQVAAGRDLQRQPGQRVENALLRPGQLQADFRIAMQLPPERDDVVADRADLIGERGSCLNRHRNAFRTRRQPG